MWWMLKKRRYGLTVETVALLVIFGLAATTAHAAGFKTFQIPASAGGPAISAVMWTPCATPPKNLKLDTSIVVPGVMDCPIVGNKLPLIAISHGGGGSIIDHHDTAEVLADAGFIVVALKHPHDPAPGLDNTWLIERPTDIKRLVYYMLGSSPVTAKIDPRRIGFFGFSRGGYTGLILADAVPDYPTFLQIWLQSAILMFNRGLSAKHSDGAAHSPGYDPRFKAFAIVDPVTFFPDKDSLRKVTAPLQLWSSQSGGPGVSPEKVAAVASDLPARPEFHPVPNSVHSSFVMPCSPALAKVAPQLCTDPPGFDRVAFHKEFDAQVLGFFRKHL